MCVNEFFQKFQHSGHEPVGRMQFERFEKDSNANKFQIEWEKLYDHFLIINIKKLYLPGFNCLKALETSRLQRLIGSYIFLLSISQSQFSIL